MAGRSQNSDRTRSYKTTSTTKKSNATRSFSSVSSSQAKARLAREKQKRQYEQQKREKIIFALFVVIILVLIIFAILIFKKVLGNSTPKTDGKNTTETSAPVVSGQFKEEMVAGDQVNRGSLVLVTENDKITQSSILDLKPTEGKPYTIGAGGSELEETAAGAFVQMATDAYDATGYKLNVQNAYSQTDKGEFSSGLLLDISLSVSGTTHRIDDPGYMDVFNWLKTNAAKYGFVMRQPERTHYCFRYVGVPHASYILEKSTEDTPYTLEEYLTFLRESHEITSDGKGETLYIKGESGGRYEIYYVKSTGGDMASVPILKDATSYEISGDNMGGFIVTAYFGK